MCFKCNITPSSYKRKFFDSHFFSDPLRDDVVGYNDDAGAGHEPEGVKAEKRIIKSAFLRVVLQSKECGVDEHAPAGGSKHHLEINQIKTVSFII